MIPYAKVEKGLADYLDGELMPMIPETGFQRIIAGTAISLLIKKGGSQIAALKENPAVKMMGIFDDAGNVDVETLRDELKKNMPEDGVKVEVPMLGMLTFRKGDIDKLYSYITMNV